MAIFLLLAGIFFLVSGALMIMASDVLYNINEYFINVFYKFFNYLNTLLSQFCSYLNKTFIKSDGVFSYRITVAVFAILSGLCMLYTYSYYSQHGSLPAIAQSFLDQFHFTLRTWAPNFCQ